MGGWPLTFIWSPEVMSELSNVFKDVNDPPQSTCCSIDCILFIFIFLLSCPDACISPAGLQVHRKIREDSDMAQDSLQCLAQLASMHGPVFPDEAAQVSYLAHLVEGLLSMINGSVNASRGSRQGDLYMCLRGQFPPTDWTPGAIKKFVK